MLFVVRVLTPCQGFIRLAIDQVYTYAPLAGGSIQYVLPFVPHSTLTFEALALHTSRRMRLALSHRTRARYILLTASTRLR